LDPSFDLGQRSFQGRDLCQLALALQITDRGYLMVASVVIMSHITSQLGKELGRRIVLLLFRKRVEDGSCEYRRDFALSQPLSKRGVVSPIALLRHSDKNVTDLCENLRN